MSTLEYWTIQVILASACRKWIDLNRTALAGTHGWLGQSLARLAAEVVDEMHARGLS